MLRYPRVLWLAAALAITLALPSVLADFYCDDQVMVLRLDGHIPSPVPGPWHLYTFATGQPDERQGLVDPGPLPWWTAAGLRLSFFRPLSSGLFALDHALAGRRPLLYHLHSLAWYVAAVLAAATVLRRLLPERAAAAASLLFAVSPAHWMLAAWPAARHVAVSGAFALAALALHLRARRGGPGPSRLVSPGALGCALAALAGGETALGLFAYVAAFEILGSGDARGRRLRALAPWVALLVIYAALYKGLGFGVSGSGAYVDPATRPEAYLALLPSRLAVFAGAALLCIPSELSTLAPQLIPVLAGLGIGASVVLGLLVWRALSALAPAQVRTLGWLLAGAVAAVLPGAAGIPGDRVLFMPNLGLTAALATVLLHAGVGKPGAAAKTVAARAGVGLFALVHVAAAPLIFAFGAAQLASTSHAALAAAARAEIPARPDVRVLGVGLSDPLVGMYLAAALGLADRPAPLPGVVHMLSMSAHDHRVTRVDERTVEIEVIGGALLEGAFEYVFRGPQAPLVAGEVVPFGSWSIRVLDVTSGRPSRFSLTFDRPADDPTLAWIAWRYGALRALPIPPVGQSLFVPHERGPMGI